jgi:hypothetical protein
MYIAVGDSRTQNMWAYDRYTKGIKPLFDHEPNMTDNQIGEQTFDFLTRQLLQATEVKTALVVPGTSSVEYCDS